MIILIVAIIITILVAVVIREIKIAIIEMK